MTVSQAEPYASTSAAGQDMSSESAGLDEIGLISCHLDQWIVSGPLSKRWSEKKKKTRYKRTRLQKNQFLEPLSANGECLCVRSCVSLQSTARTSSPAESLGLLPVIWAHPLQVQVHRGPSVVINRAPLQVDRVFRSVP